MAKLIKLFEENEVSTYCTEYMENIETIVKRYIRNGGTLKSYKIHKILFMTHNVEFEFIYVYELLLNYGYKLKNNYVIAAILDSLAFIISGYFVDDGAMNYYKEYSIIRLLNNLEFRKKIDKSELIIKDKDIDEILKLNDGTLFCYRDLTVNDIIAELLSFDPENYYLKHQHKKQFPLEHFPKFNWPKITVKFEKYKEIYENMYKNNENNL